MIEVVKCVRHCLHNKTKYIGRFKVYIKQCYRISWSVEKIPKVKIQKLQGKNNRYKHNAFIKMCSVR